jgi:hypothetical protein
MHQLSVKLLSDWQSYFGFQNYRYMAYCSKMRQAAKLHKVPNTDVNFIWKQKKSEQNKWEEGGGGLPYAENWTPFCKFWYSGTRTVSTPAMRLLLLHPVSFICREEAENFTKGDTKYVTAVIWRNFYLKEEMERSSSHILCITAVKLTLQTLCRHLILSILTLQSTWRSWIRTSWYNCEINQQDALYRLIYYSRSVLHVSGDVFAHNQEHLTVFTVYGNVHPSYCRLVSRVSYNSVATPASSSLGEHYQIL